MTPPDAGPALRYTEYLKQAYGRALEREAELLRFVHDLAVAVDLHGDGVTFGQVRENVTGLRESYASVCDRLHSAVKRHKLGLGGEHVDELVIAELDRLSRRVPPSEGPTR